MFVEHTHTCKCKIAVSCDVNIYLTVNILCRACVDTTERGDLGECKLLANYHEEHEFGTFSRMDMMNYTVNIYNDGNTLEVVTNAGKCYLIYLTYQ